MYFDWTYLVFVVPAMIFALIVQASVKGNYKKYSQVRTSNGITGFEAARRMLDANGLRNVRIEMISGTLSDNFSPKENVLHLSEAVYGGTTVAAVGIACHEAGHAIQHAQEYGPAKFRMAIVPVTNFGSKLSIPLIIIGIIFGGLSELFIMLAYLGIILYGLSVVFQLVTLPVEFNASKRALNLIDEYGLLSEDELPGAKKMLSSAALTYVAALAVSIGMLLRFLMIVNRRR